MSDRPTSARDHKPKPMRASEVAPETEQDLAAIAAQNAVAAKQARQRAMRRTLGTPSSPDLHAGLEARVEAQREASARAFRARQAAAKKMRKNQEG